MAVRATLKEPVFPTFSQWTGAFATDPIVGTEVPIITELDMGTISVAGTLLSDAKAVTVEFKSGFDDTIEDGIRVWGSNQLWAPAGEHTFNAEVAAGATFPAISLDAVMAGGTAAELGGSPYESNHIVTKANGYDSANNRIATVLLQLVMDSVTAKQFNQANSLHTGPSLQIEAPRTDFDVVGLQDDQIAMDETAGALHIFSAIKVYKVELDSTGNEYWMDLGGLLDDQVTITGVNEYVEWRRRKPKVTMHIARSDVQGSVAFKCDSPSPKLLAIANQATSTRNTTDRTNDSTLNAKSTVVSKGKWVVEYFTQGMHIERCIIPNGVLKVSGDFTPGGDDFAGRQFEVQALSNGTPNHELMNFKTTDTPVEVFTLPLTYNITA